MSRILVFTVLVFFSSLSFAVGLEVIGKDGKSLFSNSYNIEPPSNVGLITVGVLEENEISFDGSELGIREMFDLTNDLEIISKTEMKAWGWCFSLDGEVPETLTHETLVTKTDSKIVWFYAFAHYLEGEWISQCEVAY